MGADTTCDKPEIICSAIVDALRRQNDSEAVSKQCRVPNAAEAKLNAKRNCCSHGGFCFMIAPSELNSLLFEIILATYASTNIFLRSKLS